MSFSSRNTQNFLFKHRAREQPVGYLNYKRKTKFVLKVAPGQDSGPAQVGGVPAARLDLFLEEPLDTFGMFRRALILEQTADFRGQYDQG